MTNFTVDTEKEPIKSYIRRKQIRNSEIYAKTEKSHLKAFQTFSNSEYDFCKQNMNNFADWLKLEKNYADSTTREIIGSTYRLANYCHTNGLIDELPEKINLKWLSTEKEISKSDQPYIDKDEWKELWDLEIDAELRVILGLLRETGIRVGELINLELNDIDPKQRSIRVDTLKRDNHDRTLYYSPSLSRLIRNYLKHIRPQKRHANDSDRVFLGPRTHQLDRSWIRREITKLYENAGIQETLYKDAAGDKRKRLNVHSLRHSFAVSFILNGGDVSQVRKLLGHADISTTQRYLRYTEDDNKEVQQQYGPSI